MEQVPSRVTAIAGLLSVAALSCTALLHAQSATQGGFQLADPTVDEASGIAASLANTGIYWTFNDSEGGAVLYAFDASGASHGRWTLADVRNLDWEGIAVGPGPSRGRSYIYVGDIGDNQRKRGEILVYRVEEPKISDPSACAKGCRIPRVTTLGLRYPDSPHNAEALLLHPGTGDLYVITKAGAGDVETSVYVIRANELGAKPSVLTLVATLEVPDPFYRAFAGGITGGDISPDGRRVVLCDYFRIYEAEAPAGNRFDRVWRGRFVTRTVSMGLQVEGAAYRADGKAILAISEGKPCRVMELPIE
jgi:hypothetical protein